MSSSHLTRRRVLGTLGAAGVVGLAGCAGDDGGDTGDDGGSSENTRTETPSDVDVRIGIMQEITGPNGPEFGHQGLSGFFSGLAYKADGDPEPLPDPLTAIAGTTVSYTVNDIEFELHVRDTGGDYQDAGRHARELVEEENVDILYGLSNSDSLTRVINTVIKDDTVDVPLFVGQAATTAVTSDADLCDRQVFRVSESTGMSCRTGGVYIAQETDIDRVALFGADYTFGRDVVRNYEDVFSSRDVEIVVNEIVPRGFADWKPKIDLAEERGAEAIIYGFTTATATPFFTTYVGAGPDTAFLPYDMQLIGDMPDRLSLGRLSSRVSELAPDGNITRELIEAVNFGPLSNRYQWNQYDNDINDWFRQAHVDTYGVVPDLFTSSAFTSASAIVQAFEEYGETNRDAIIDGVHGMTVEATPKGTGEYEFQTYNNQARSPMTMSPVIPKEEANWPAGLQPGEPIFRLNKNDTAIPRDSDLMTCDLG